MYSQKLLWNNKSKIFYHRVIPWHFIYTRLKEGLKEKIHPLLKQKKKTYVR